MAHQGASPTSKARQLARARSRSLSVSLAQEQEARERASTAPPKKPMLNREISMSRTFKPKPKPAPAATTKAKAEAPPPKSAKPKDVPVTLVEETPVKPKGPVTAGSRAVFPEKNTRQPSLNEMLARAGPSRKRTVSTKRAMEPTVIDGDDELQDEWMMDSSPDVVLLNPLKRSSSTSSTSGITAVDTDEEDDGGVQETPSKPSRSGKRRNVL